MLTSLVYPLLENIVIFAGTVDKERIHFTSVDAYKLSSVILLNNQHSVLNSVFLDVLRKLHLLRSGEIQFNQELALFVHVKSH